LHNLYNVTDLQTWCKDHGLSHLGKKPLIIRYILDYLETGKIPAKTSSKKKKRLSNSGGSTQKL